MFLKTLLQIFFLAVVQVQGLDEFLRGQSVLYGLSSITNETTRNTTCFQELHELFEGVELQKFWASKVLDASGQPNPGFLWGNNLWLGSLSQCIDIMNRKPLEINKLKVKHPDSTPYDFPPFPLIFVMAYMIHNDTSQLHTQMPLENMIELGLCVPLSCSTTELHDLLQRYLDRRYLNAQKMFHLDIKIHQIKQVTQSESFMTLPKSVITIFICSVSLLLVLLGTIYDVNVTQPNIESKNAAVESSKELKKVPKARFGSKFGNIIQCFSMYSNTKALLKTDISPDSIEALHGVRLFSLVWVTFVHGVYFQIDYLDNVPTGFRLSEGFTHQILSNSTYCVDSFLFLSGFLISYTFYKAKGKHLKQKVRENLTHKVMEFFVMFFHRYLRLTPVYLATILISDTLFTYYRQTSVLYASEQPDINCPKYWWRNLLYVNNFYPRSEMCMSWSWYLSADTQFFIVASILLLMSTLSFKTASTLVFFCIALCMAITGYRSYSIGYIPTMDEQFIQLDAIYDFPWNRIGPYLIGVITGYILVVKLEGKLVLKKSMLVLCWIVFPMINLWILFTLHGRDLSVEFSAVYMGISRTLWGFGMGWLFIACYTGNAGIINKFLSYSGWIPLSRLTYCCYLLNPLLISIIFLGTDHSQSASNASFAVTLMGTCILTFFIAFWYSLFFESPYILLTKMMFKNLTKCKNRNQNGNPA